MRLPAPDRDDDLPRHTVAPLDRIEGPDPLLQEGAACLCQRDELAFHKIASWGLELHLQLVRGCLLAGRLEVGKLPVERNVGEGSGKSLARDTLLLSIGPDGLGEPIVELGLDSLPSYLQRLRPSRCDPSRENSA